MPVPVRRPISSKKERKEKNSDSTTVKTTSDAHPVTDHVMDVTVAAEGEVQERNEDFKMVQTTAEVHPLTAGFIDVAVVPYMEAQEGSSGSKTVKTTAEVQPAAARFIDIAVVPEVQVQDDIVETNMMERDSKIEPVRLCKNNAESVPNFVNVIPMGLVYKCPKENFSPVVNDTETLVIFDNNFEAADEVLQGIQAEESTGKPIIRMVKSDLRHTCFIKMASTFGFKVKELTIIYCDIDVASFRFMLHHQFKNLEKLCLHANNFMDETDGPCPTVPRYDWNVLTQLEYFVLETYEDRTQPFFLEDIVRMYPRVKIFRCHFPPIMTESSFIHYPWDSLVELSLFLASNDTIKFFVENLVKMKSLNYLALWDLGHSATDNLRVFIQSLSASLVELTLHEQCHSRESTVFPLYLPQLKIISVTPLFFQSFDMLAHIPNLEWFKLCGNQANIEFWNDICHKTNLKIRYPSVKIVSFPHINLKDFTRIVYLFPNLQVVSMEPRTIENGIHTVFPILNFHIVVKVLVKAIHLNNWTARNSAGPTKITQKDFYRVVKYKDWPSSSDKPLRLSPFLDGTKYIEGCWFGGGDKRSHSDRSHLDKLITLVIIDSRITDIALYVIGNSMPELKLLQLVRCNDVTSKGVRRLQNFREDIKIVVDSSEHSPSYCHGVEELGA